MRKANLVLFGILFLAFVFSLSCSCENTLDSNGSISTHLPESPFGIFEVELEDIEYLPDLGVKVVINSLPPFLGLKESQGPNPWPEATARYQEHLQEGVEVMPVIPLTNEEFNDMTLQEYYDGVKVLVNHFDQSEYFLLTLEAEGMGMGDGATKDDPERYALFIRLAYKALKVANPSAKLATAGSPGTPCAYDEEIEPCVFPPGVSNANYFKTVFQEINYLEEIEKNPSLYNWNENKYNLTQEEFDLIFEPDSYEDYMEVHQFSAFVFDAREYRKNARLYEVIREVLDREGFAEVELWNTQTGTHSGTPTGMLNVPQTEKKQAEIVVKHYVMSFAHDIEKIFWNGVYEIPMASGGLGDPPDPDNFFSVMPLVYDGEGQEGANNKDVKKLSYYTFKKMVEVLEGSDWDNVQTVQEDNGVYVYKFTKDGKPIWVAWNDNLATQTIILNVGNINTAKIIKAIPKYNSGKEVTDYNTAFEIEVKQTTNGVVTISLGDSPIFIQAGH
ncbi:MAG: hypothetical protein ACE5HI_19385 [bacterium]